MRKHRGFGVGGKKRYTIRFICEHALVQIFESILSEFNIRAVAFVATIQINKDSSDTLPVPFVKVSEGTTMQLLTHTRIVPS